MSFNPKNVNLDEASEEDIICYLSTSGNEYDGRLGARISSIFVILVTSSICTLFPVIAKRVPSWKIPYSVYQFARFFGTGVIVATAFIHLLDPAYENIGTNSCVAASGHWGDYPWCACIVLASVTGIFLMDLGAEVYVEQKYGVHRDEDAMNAFLSDSGQPHMHTPDDTEAKLPDDTNCAGDDSTHQATTTAPQQFKTSVYHVDEKTPEAERSFRQQIAAFLILEFGVVFHSVIIGLNLGVTGDEFATLYPVLVFHQAFEGLGIGSRLSTIPFGKHAWLPWILCAAYGLCTPISIAIGLGVRTSYAPESKTAMIVQGVLNSISAGILIYTGLVELLARDFLFDPSRTKSRLRLLYMVFCTLFGAGIMALLGKWA